MKLSVAANRSPKPKKLNSDVSPHRAGIYLSTFRKKKLFLVLKFKGFVHFLIQLLNVFVVSAVRLMRIELGGAFADLLNEKGKGSGENEMGYVQRTLGFSTRELNNQDLRLVIYPFQVSTHFHLYIIITIHVMFWSIGFIVKIKLRISDTYEAPSQKPYTTLTLI